ncbi:hypothetical protein U9M48_037946 [Paspalum notatum var. saurae]|uniref:Uncharacterized protein n=1 Tax=Paspalum notatum var. saurae TaxID=547442 RepID=A0AAQ3UIA3_PASNO
MAPHALVPCATADLPRRGPAACWCRAPLRTSSTTPWCRAPPLRCGGPSLRDTAASADSADPYTLIPGIGVAKQDSSGQCLLSIDSPWEGEI